jgi:hypothetical protein
MKSQDILGVGSKAISFTRSDLEIGAALDLVFLNKMLTCRMVTAPAREILPKAV